MTRRPGRGRRTIALKDRLTPVLISLVSVIVVFGAAGFAFAQWLPLAAAMIASGYLGTVYGSAWLERLPEETFRRWFRIGITLLAADMIRRGLVSLL